MQKLNYCRPCTHDFGSVSLFDRHRLGTHEYTFRQGLDRDPPAENGRRCLSIQEMETKGWELDDRGRWVDPEKVAQARRAFAKAA